MSPNTASAVVLLLLAVGAFGASDDVISPRDEISDLACSPDSSPYVFTDHTATFASPGSPLYPLNSICQWLIVGQEAGGFVEFDFTLLSLERYYDFVTLYDGSTTLAPVLASFDGTWSPAPTTIRSTQTSVLFVFKSDESINDRGFNVTYTSVPWFNVRDPCSSLSRPLLVTDGAGEITSPYFSNNYYMNYANCQWLIESQVPGGIVTLDFLDFSTERWVDIVYLYDGPTVGARLIASLNGTQVTTGWQSTQTYLLVRFTTNAWNVLSGWRAAYTSQASP